MLRTTLAGLRAHRLRLFLTSLAIMLGVGFIAGTFILTDTLEAALTQKVTASADKVDVAVLPSESSGGLTAKDLAKIRFTPGVTDAQGLVREQLTLLGKDGRPLSDVPSTAFSVSTGKLNRTAVTEGQAPDPDSRDAVLDENTAHAHGFNTGDTITVVDHKQIKRKFRLSGVFDPGVDRNLTYGGGIGFTLPTVQSLTGAKTFYEIDVLGAGPPAELKQELSQHDFIVKTSSELSSMLAESSGLNAGQLTLALLLFGVIAMFVAALVIYNTFSILIAQRTREMALLRSLGASRAQVFGSVLFESALVGVLSSLLGVVVGYGLGALALMIMDVLRAPLPVGAAPVLNPSVIGISLAVGLVVTVGAALLPARAATRVPPIAALRTQVEEQTFKTGVIRSILAGLLLLGSGGLIGLALTMKQGEESTLIAAMAGSAVFFLAVLVLGPVLMRPLSALVGWVPRQLFGVSGKLAANNSARNPRRAATTTIALTIGVTLMTLISVITASSRATVDTKLATWFPHDYQLSAQTGGDMSRAVGDALDKRPEFASVARIRGTTGTIDGYTYLVSSFVGPIDEVVTSGSLKALHGDTMAVPAYLAKDLHLKVGDTVKLKTKHDGSVGIKVVAVLGVSDNTVLQGLTFAPDVFDRYFGKRGDQRIFVKNQAAVDPVEARKVVDTVLQPYPTVTVQSSTDMRKGFEDALNMAMVIISGLLGLAVLISLVGIANTLSLSVHERVRESGLLRALGLTRAQLRNMFSIEALLLGLIGALIGVALGTGFAWLAIRSMLKDVVFVLPYGQIVLLMVGAGLAGVIASLLPARRAARASIVESLAAA